VFFLIFLNYLLVGGAQMAASVEKLLVEKLVGLVKKSQWWPPREGSLVKLLDVYARFYPDPPTHDAIEQARTGSSDMTRTRLNDKLKECFLKDRSLWSDQQRILIHRGQGLQLEPVSPLLGETLKFWFSQCVRIPSTQGAVGWAPQSFIVLSEPLCFFCRTLNGYFRFLDVNHDGQFETQKSESLVAQARDRLRQTLEARLLTNSISGKPQRNRKIAAREKTITKELAMFVAALDLVPTRNYIPAGDSTAAGQIRNWFRDSTNCDIHEKEAMEVSDRDSTKSNLIILASRSSLPLLDRFQNTHQELRILLTKTGISFDKKPLDDEIGNEGFRMVYVVVTSWTFETGNVHTYIASNHTRALGAVAELLVSDKALGGISLVDSKGRIPRRFQLAFEVPLHLHEMQAGEPRLLPSLESRPLPYGEEEMTRDLSSPSVRSA
jgi:hypothetical protein